MVDKELVRRRVGFIQDELVKLEQFSGVSLNEIASDYIKQAALERFLERLVNYALDTNQHLLAELAPKEMSPPTGYKETFTKVAELGVYPLSFGEQISKSVGTRNILIHEYEKVDYQRIYSSVDDALGDYAQYCQYVLDFLEKLGKT